MMSDLFERLHNAYKKRERTNEEETNADQSVNKTLRTAFQPEFFAWLEQALLYKCPATDGMALLHFTANLARLEDTSGKVVDVYMCHAKFLDDDLEPFQTLLGCKLPDFDVSCGHKCTVTSPHDDEDGEPFGAQYTFCIDWST